LDEEGRPAFELGIRREESGVEGERLDAIDDDLVALLTFVPGLLLVALLLGGVIGRNRVLGRSGTVGRELGLTLLPLKAGDLVFETLVFLSEGQDFGVEVLDEVEETDDGVASDLVGNAVEVEVQVEIEVGHGCLRRE
jgi:hypothetical protein